MGSHSYSLKVSRKQDQNDRTTVQVHDPLVGTEFDRRFHIDFRIAVGGFGAIYHATHKNSGHQFALKILHARLAADPGVIARFRREGDTLTRLRSPNTIIAYEMGEADDGTLFIVLELLHGESLFERYRSRGRFEWKQMASIARGVCASLEEAHGLGIIHRDLKPTNINLEIKDGDENFAKVLDFGIAKILHQSDLDSQDLTNAGQMIGTLDYMSPEQMVGGVCTGQTDIYTLGIVMYEMIAGRRPFAEANSPAAVLAAMLRTDPDPLSGLVPIPKAMDRIVMKCLAREPEQRWASVAELGTALDRVLGGVENAERGDITRTVPVSIGEESTIFEERPRPLVTAPYPAQIVRPSDSSLGEAPTEPAQVPAPARPRGALPTTIPGRPAPPPTTPPPVLRSQVTPTPVTNRKQPTTPPDVGGRPSQAALPTHGARPSQPAVPTHGARPSQAALPTPGDRSSQAALPTAPLFGRAAAGGPTSAAPLPGSDLALFPPPPPHQRKSPTAPPPMAVIQPPGPPQPLPHSARPVMDLASFAQPAQLSPTPPAPGMPGFDMSQLAARDAAVRRIVWIVVLVVAALIGVVVAAQL